MPRWPATRPPLFIECVVCGALKEVRDRRQQRRQKTCSKRCQGKRSGHVRLLTRSQRQAAAEKSKRTRRAAALARLEGMTPLEIYRTAFSVGWKAGARSVRRRLGGTSERTPRARPLTATELRAELHATRGRAQ